jgi:shikimate dehydrogenase
MRQFGLIGKTLIHSFSKTYFSRKFALEGLDDCRYDNYELASIAELPALFSAHPDLRGLNVTIPYKEDVLTYLDELSPAVAAIGACNCILIRDGKKIGYNTDAYGFTGSIRPFLQPQDRRALVLGTGGASKAVCYALKQLDIAYHLVSRQGRGAAIGYEDLDADVMRSCTVIVNTTPLGTFPKVDEAPPIPFELITDQHLLFDLVYNPAKTLFLQRGEARGARIANGYRMLELQAEASWEHWK